MTATKTKTRDGVPLRLLGARIRRARKAKGLSHEMFGHLVGCSRIHSMRLEKGVHEPSEKLLARIAEVTEQPLSFFVRKPSTRRSTDAPDLGLTAEALDAIQSAATSLVGALMKAVAEAKAMDYDEEML